MSETRPVIVATDGSPHSLRILPHAAAFATARPTSLALLRVLDRGEVAKEPGESDEQALERTRSRLRHELAGTLTRWGIEGEAEVDVASSGQDIAGVLLHRAATAELMALDSRGRGGLAALLHGSVAKEVLAQAEAPFMMSGPMLLGPPADGGIYRIVATTDCSEASQDVFRAIGPMLEAGRFKVTLLYVHEQLPGGEDDEADVIQRQAQLAAIRNLLPPALDVEVMMRRIPRGAGVDTAILEEARDANAHAIAMSTHGQGRRRDLLMGSVAMSMLGRATVPLILARV